MEPWCKALVFVGGLVPSRFMEVERMSGSRFEQISAGMFLTGLREWRNHKFVRTIKPLSVHPGPVMLISIPVWNRDPVGVFFDTLGAASVVLGA